MDGMDAVHSWKSSKNLLMLFLLISIFLLFLFTDRGTGSETGLKHYLIIVLAVICILIVGALTILLLRRPAFCKKHGGRSSTGSNSGGGGASGNFHQNMLQETSVSPTPADSLPMAMNTGIFVPGGSYDWQETRFQEATLTGTSVFK